VKLTNQILFKYRIKKFIPITKSPDDWLATAKNLPPRASRNIEVDSEFTDRENEDNGAERGKRRKDVKKEAKRSGGWQGGRRRKVRLEKRRRVNDPGSRDGTKKVRRSGERQGGERGGERGRLVWCTFFVRYFTENGRSPPLPLVAQKRV